jgi:hypothetical protein
MEKYEQKPKIAVSVKLKTKLQTLKKIRKSGRMDTYEEVILRIMGEKNGRK